MFWSKNFRQIFLGDHGGSCYRVQTKKWDLERTYFWPKFSMDPLSMRDEDYDAPWKPVLEACHHFAFCHPGLSVHRCRIAVAWAPFNKVFTMESATGPETASGDFLEDLFLTTPKMKEFHCTQSAPRTWCHTSRSFSVVADDSSRGGVQKYSLTSAFLTFSESLSEGEIQLSPELGC